MEADPVLYEDGSIEFSIPDAMTIKGENVIANDIWIREDGELLYRYDLRVCNLPKPGLMINGAQIFLKYDGTKLALRKAEGIVDWTVSERGGKLLCAWASETDMLLREDDIVLTLWFAKGANVRPGERVDISFIVNSLGQKSSLSFLFADKVTDVAAITIDGRITFGAIVYGDANCEGMVMAADAALILRAIVGLSELTPRGTLNGDADGDGEITAEDAALILRYVVELIEAFPAEDP